MKNFNFLENKEERALIWMNYIKRINSSVEGYDLNQQAPCPFCGGIMLKAQYQKFQPNKKFSWDIDNINFNRQDKRYVNLQPIHPWCKIKRGNING